MKIEMLRERLMTASSESMDLQQARLSLTINTFINNASFSSTVNKIY